MSGLYQPTLFVGQYSDDDVYFNSPLYYLPNLADPWHLELYRRSRITFCCRPGRVGGGRDRATRARSRSSCTRRASRRRSTTGATTWSITGTGGRRCCATTCRDCGPADPVSPRAGVLVAVSVALVGCGGPTPVVSPGLVAARRRASSWPAAADCERVSGSEPSTGRDVGAGDAGVDSERPSADLVQWLHVATARPTFRLPARSRSRRSRRRRPALRPSASVRPARRELLRAAPGHRLDIRRRPHVAAERRSGTSSTSTPEEMVALDDSLLHIRHDPGVRPRGAGRLRGGAGIGLGRVAILERRPVGAAAAARRACRPVRSTA